MNRRERTIAVLMDRHGRTYAQDAGIRLTNKPAPLWQLFVLTELLSARINADIAVAATRELFADGLRTAQEMADSTWQQRVDALGRGGYRRYDERTATMLGDAAEFTLAEHSGDLRRLREAAASGRPIVDQLQDFKGIGPGGATIFCREIQGVWPELAPYVDDLAMQGAERLGLPRTPRRLAAYVATNNFPALVAACVRAARDPNVVDDVNARLSEGAETRRQ